MSILIINKKRGFTLIELLIVISIIAILAAMAIFGIGNVFEKARNTQRRSDIKQYQEALEVWANSHNGLYPVRSGADQDADSVLCNDLGLGTGCPSDPIDTQEYKYRSSTGTGSGGTCSSCAAEYVLWAQLEESSTTYFVACYNGRVGTTSSSPTLTTCDSL